MSGRFDPAAVFKRGLLLMGDTGKDHTDPRSKLQHRAEPSSRKDLGSAKSFLSFRCLESRVQSGRKGAGTVGWRTLCSNDEGN